MFSKLSWGKPMKLINNRLNDTAIVNEAKEFAKVSHKKNEMQDDNDSDDDHINFEDGGEQSFVDMLGNNKKLFTKVNDTSDYHGEFINTPYSIHLLLMSAHGQLYLLSQGPTQLPYSIFSTSSTAYNITSSLALYYLIPHYISLFVWLPGFYIQFNFILLVYSPGIYLHLLDCLMCS